MAGPASYTVRTLGTEAAKKPLLYRKGILASILVCGEWNIERTSAMVSLWTAVAAAASVVSVAAATTNPAQWNGIWTAPPIRVPSAKSVDGPLLGDGEAGLVLGGSARSARGGGSQVVVSAYLSSNTAWVLDECTGTSSSCGSSHRAGIGGLEFAFETPLTSSNPEQHAHASFALTFKQDLVAGTVGWFVWEENGVAPPPPPPPSPPPSPPPVPGCSIVGDWLQQGGSGNASRIFPNGKNNSNGSFLWPNWDPKCLPAPEQCQEGWRYCTGTVDNGTGMIALDYHRFEAAGSGGGCKKIHTASGATEWICEQHGSFDGDCDHLQFRPPAGTAGKWHRNGSPPPPPPPPPTPPPPPPPPPTPSKLFMSGTIALGQQSIGEGPSVFITTLQLHAAATEPATVAVRTWVFGDASQNQSGVAPLLLPPPGSGGGGGSGGIGWARRELLGTDTPVTGVIATRLLSPATASTMPKATATGVTQNVTVPAPGAVGQGGENDATGPVLFAHVLLTSYTAGPNDPLPQATAVIAAATPGSAAVIGEQASEYWATFWNRSSISLPSRPKVEEYWYKSQYLMGMASRSGRVAPGLWGPWVSTDSPAWSGGYTLDYNFEMPFQGLFSSNHADVAESFYPQVIAYAIRNGGNDAKEAKCVRPGGVHGLPGAVHFAVQLAPGGIKNYANALGINTNAAFASLNFISAFEFSQNVTFLQTVSYPLLRAVAAFWNCSLQMNSTTGRWDDIECTREGCFNGPGSKGRVVDHNPAIAIGFIRRVLSHLVDVAARGLVPNIPADELAGWKDVLERLAPIPVGVAPGSAGGNPDTELLPVLLPQEWPVNHKLY